MTDTPGPILAELARHRDWLRAELAATEAAIEAMLARQIAGRAQADPLPPTQEQ